MSYPSDGSQIPKGVGIEDLLEVCGLSPEEVAEAGTSIEELHRIYLHHVEQRASLEITGVQILELLRTIPKVHTARSRVKNPARLVRKIVRKRTDDPNRIITLDNYEREITDLIGLRALHLFKEDWLAIHDFITKEWNPPETPIAYVREGDPHDWIQQFRSRGCQVEQHPRSYRSVHYLIPTSPTKRTITVEIQVRTLMEEAWSEIDHRINYPKPTAYDEVRHFLLLFNRLAGMADEMGSFVNGLEHQFERAELERDAAKSEYDTLLNQLNLTASQRRTLEESLSAIAGKTMGDDPKSPDIQPIAEAVDAATYLSDHSAPSLFADFIRSLTITRTCSQCRQPFGEIGSSAYVDPPVCSKCAAASTDDSRKGGE
jgi:putative GTP pyrophosphokinase